MPSGRTDKPSSSGDVSVGTVRAAASPRWSAAVPLSLLSGWRAALVHLVAIGSAWAYNLGLKATVVSPLPYALSFGLLPAFVTLGLPGHPWPRPAVDGGHRAARGRGPISSTPSPTGTTTPGPGSPGYPSG